VKGQGESGGRCCVVELGDKFEGPEVMARALNCWVWGTIFLEQMISARGCIIWKPAPLSSPPE
jgi:hypothetical protein